MQNLDGWSWALWVIAGYVAVTSLARLMAFRRDALAKEIGDQIASSPREEPSAASAP